MKDRAKKILVTGYCGLIGSAVFQELKSKGFKLKGIDLSSPIEAFKGNIINVQRINSGIQDCDGIIHLAAV